MNYDTASICDAIALLEGDHDWTLEADTYNPGCMLIRGHYPDRTSTCCPLLAYSWRIPHPEKMGLYESLAGQAIMDAADDRPGHNPKVRQRLLEACGLAEPEPEPETESPVWTWLAVIGIIGLALAVLYRFQGS
jgi:hypothetical protein